MFRIKTLSLDRFNVIYRVTKIFGAYTLLRVHNANPRSYDTLLVPVMPPPLRVLRISYNEQSTFAHPTTIRYR